MRNSNGGPKTAATTTEQSSDRLLRARDVADWLDFSPATVVDWAERGELPCFRIGGRLRFRESEVLAWIEDRRAGRFHACDTCGKPTRNPYRIPGANGRLEHVCEEHLERWSGDVAMVDRLVRRRTA